MEKTYLKFLKSGSLEVSAPKNWEKMSETEKQSWGEAKLNEASDQEIIEAMSDFEKAGRSELFDEIELGAVVEPLSSEDSPKEYVGASPEWILWALGKEGYAEYLQEEKELNRAKLLDSDYGVSSQALGIIFDITLYSVKRNGDSFDLFGEDGFLDNFSKQKIALGALSFAEQEGYPYVPTYKDSLDDIMNDIKLMIFDIDMGRGRHSRKMCA